MKRTFILSHAEARQRAIDCIKQSPDGYRVVVQENTRSVAQNDRMWATLTDIAEQVNWHGQKLTPEEWKNVMTAALKKQKVVPGIDGGFVVMGQRTSKMTKGEMADVIALAESFGAEHGVKFGGGE